MNKINVVKTNGIGGEWIKVTITLGDKVFTRNTAPNGSPKYANVTNGGNTSIRADGPSAAKIDKAIAAAAE